MIEYTFKTDRNKQWAKQKEHRLDVSRKKKEELEHYFFTGEIKTPNRYPVHTLLFYHPQQNVKQWNMILNGIFNHRHFIGNRDSYIDVDDFYQRLQKRFLDQIISFDFDIEDRAWIFKQVFGDTYDSGREFPMLLPNEKEKRVISVSANGIAASLFVDVNRVLRNKVTFSYVEYLEVYLKSILPFISTRAFSVNVDDRDEVYSIWSAVKKILHFSSLGEKQVQESDNIKLLLSKKIRNIFEDYDGDLGEYQKLVALVEQGGVQL